MKKQNSKQNASATGDFYVVIPKYDFKRPGKIFGEKTEIETYIIQSKQKIKKKYCENSSCRIFLQEQVKLLKSGTWFQFYNASNKNTFF